MNKKFLGLLLAGLPVLSFASTGDTTFNDIVTQLEAYLGGSLGLVFVLIGFLGAGAAIAGFAPMKVMFPVFGLTLALHYGPKILETIFAATGELPMSHVPNFTLCDLVCMLASGAILAIGIERQRKGQTNE